MVEYSVEEKRDIGKRLHMDGISSRSLHRTHGIHYKSAQRYLRKVTHGYPLMASGGRPRTLSDMDVLEISRFIVLSGGPDVVTKSAIVAQIRELSHRNWYRSRTRLDGDISLIERPKKLSWKTNKRYIERAVAAIASLNLPDTN